MLQFVPTVSCPATGHHQEKLGSFLFAPSLQAFIHTLTSFLISLLLPRLSISNLSTFLHRRDVPASSPSLWPFTGFSPECPGLSSNGEPRTRHSTPGMASPVLKGGKSAQPAASILPTAAQNTISFLCCKAHYWLMFTLVSTRTPRTFLPSWFPGGLPPVFIAARGCSFSGAGVCSSC